MTGRTAVLAGADRVPHRDNATAPRETGSGSGSLAVAARGSARGDRLGLGAP